MPHLLAFNRSYWPDLGATGQLLAELCEDLVARHTWEVTVVAGPPTVTLGNGAAPESTPCRRNTVRGVTVLRAFGTRFDKAAFAGRAANYLTYFGAAAVAARQSRRPDVVMSLTDPPILGLAALAWARRWRIPFVYLCQDVFPEVAVLLDGFRNGGVTRVLDRISRLLLRRADAVVALGETMARRLTDKGADPRSVSVIHNWADRAVIRPGPRKNAFSQARDLDGRFVVLHSGNLGLGQGLESLVEAAALLRDLPDLAVVLQGDGVKREALARRVRDLGLENVRFLPYLPKDQLRCAFAASDIQIVSLRRGLAGCIVPSKVYGILASGRPYVAAVDADCEAALIAERWQAGLVTPPDDPQALAEAIRRLYDDPPLRERLGANALLASQSYDRTVAVASYHRLLSDVVARTTGSRASRTSLAS